MNECSNEQWVAENPDATIEWAHTMWSCECPEGDTASRNINIDIDSPYEYEEDDRET